MGGVVSKNCFYDSSQNLLANEIFIVCSSITLFFDLYQIFDPHCHRSSSSPLPIHMYGWVVRQRHNGATTTRPPILLGKICARRREKYIGSIVRYYLENWHLTRVISIVYQSTWCKYISCYIHNAHLWTCHYRNILVAWSKKRLSFHLTVDLIKIFGDQMNVPDMMMQVHIISFDQTLPYIGKRFNLKG